VGLEDLSHNFLTGSLEELVKWARRSSVWPATFGLACCAIEMMATGAADFDLARFGMEVFRGSPRQADLMVVAGRVSQKMAPVLRQVYDQMVEPKWVISMGVCASTGGMFNNYAIVQGVDQIVPVDVYAPGCPPNPQTLIHAILTLHEKIRLGELTKRRPGATGAGIDTAVRSRSSGDAPLMAAEVASAAELAGANVLASTRAGGQEVLHVTRERYLEVAGALRESGFEMCADLCAVDYLRHLHRPLPDEVTPERFEIVVNLLSLERHQRVRLRVQVPDTDPVVPTLFNLYPGTENMEREAFDLYGVRFEGHPDHTRILMPEDWEGHPLRKDYSVGRVPVQFKQAPGPR
jgi:NADH-quinone oxidoreductase subunit B